MLTKDQVSSLEEAIKVEPVVFSWSTVTCNSIEGDSGSHLRWIVAGAGFTGPMLLYLFIDYTSLILFILMFILGLIMMLFTRYVIMTDEYYQYELTQLGIRTSYRQVIPDVAYKVVRGFAWFGSGVCVVAVVVIGPLAFFGAGAFGLLAFKMTGFEGKMTTHSKLFSKHMLIFNPQNTNAFELLSVPYQDRCYINLVFDWEDREKILEQLTRVIPECEVIDVDKYRDIEKHPREDEAREAAVKYWEDHPKELEE